MKARVKVKFAEFVWFQGRGLVFAVSDVRSIGPDGTDVWFPTGTQKMRVQATNGIWFTLFALPCGMVCTLRDPEARRPVRTLETYFSFILVRMFGELPEPFKGLDYL